MKYKLIKEYPGSPKLDTIINDSKTTLGISYYENCKGFIGNFPEFWELIVEKDYEILSVITNNNKFIEKVYNQDAIIEPYWKIHSVKRLSDGEIFTIGDIIDTRLDNKYKQEILEISIKNNTIMFRTKLGFVILSVAVKVKKPLCTTEDGVDIYLGNKSWILHKNSWYLSPAAIVHNNSNWTPNENEAHWRFSTKEKAEEYILLNKPCLSYNEVLNATKIRNKNTFETLKNLVKSKIQQSV